MKESTWMKLAAIFREFPMLAGGTVSEREVEAAGIEVGCAFAPDYAEFVARYGGAMVGPDPVLGLRRSEVMGIDAWSVIEATRHFRSDGWLGVNDWYVISIDGSGNPVGMDPDGGVWLSDHDCGEVVRIAEDFESFILQQLDLSAQAKARLDGRI